MEKFELENENIRELPIRRSYAELQEAQDEEDKIMEMITNVLEKTENREEAKKIIDEQYMSALSDAIKKSQKARDKWNEVMKEKTIDMVEPQDIE